MLDKAVSKAAASEEEKPASEHVEPLRRARMLRANVLSLLLELLDLYAN
jgi:hypothetical protein